jgi:O-antigen ligase
VYYVKKEMGIFWGIVTIIALIVFGFLSGSRSGSILTAVGSILGFYSHLLMYGKRRTPFLIGIILILYYALQTNVSQQLISRLNPRVYDLVFKTSEVTVEDRSYLARLAMIEKAQTIFAKYPLNGIGLNNFSKFTAKIPGDFPGAELIVEKKSINRMSPHNSYFGVLAEGGVFLFVPLAFLIAYPILFFVIRLNRIPENKKPIFIGLIMMSIHLYFIFAIVNVFAWFLIGLANAVASCKTSDLKKLRVL